MDPGFRAGPYEITALIGEGGMGAVYRARDTRLDRDVAVKIVHPSFAEDPGRLQRFEREARLLASLNHPHIATIHGLEEAGGVRLLIMELVQGITLARRISTGPLPVKEALAVAVQIAAAIEAAHEGGVIHRDLKPANVMLTPGGDVKVLDFGLAKAMAAEETGPEAPFARTRTSSGTGAGVMLGTAAYMSPEQARGTGVDRRTDVWAFGCVLYEMLAGRRAFPGATDSDIIVAVLTLEPEWVALPENVPPSIRRLLRRSLEKDVRRRLHDIGDARLEIEDAIAGVPEPVSGVVALPPQRAADRKGPLAGGHGCGDRRRRTAWMDASTGSAVRPVSCALRHPAAGRRSPRRSRFSGDRPVTRRDASGVCRQPRRELATLRASPAVARCRADPRH
ncbi:MAG TPA: serine/threonine-protein kinase [Gemmatimonadaceae bacterium]|nr:serine/threonine-protein kinase [Gemmatimonadaceae bacterium]